ncbi:DNA cytosine methyltransferase [Candidatus Enterovibrio escicola]|nr:DNA cytosine methyltransferase [Candidatus Enterovibrio escacola]
MGTALLVKGIFKLPIHGLEGFLNSVFMLMKFHKCLRIGKNKMNFTFIDLFSGIGGMRVPFSELGGKCVFSSEIDKFARKTYQVNWNEEPYGDITKILPEEIRSFDLLLAGFPCQPFSQAGFQKGFDDTRGILFFYIAEIIKYHQPKVVLLENVKRLRTHDKGNTFKVMQKILEKLFYTVSSEVLSAKNFGVPQNRERIYIVALRNGETFDFPKPTFEITKVGNILQKDVPEKYTISDRLWAGHKRRKAGHRTNGNGFGYGMFTQNSSYTNTISARYYKDGSEILISQGDSRNPRKITPREAARLQGFNDNFKIVVSDLQAYKQFGNSVSVPVVRSIAKKLVYYLY